MSEIELHDIKREIGKLFPQSDLSPEESFVRAGCHLRFELGDELENGTVERVSQAVARATTLFEIFFKPGDDVWIIANTWAYPGGAREFCTSTSGYFEHQFRNWDGIDKLKTEKTIEEFGEVMNEEGVMEEADLSVTHKQAIFCEKLSNINYRNILLGVANIEMGMEPGISTKVQFINMATGVAFYMYDDRGCLVYANDCETLRPTYDKYNDWLVDFHRPLIESLFS